MISEADFNVICWIWIAFAVIMFPVLLKVKQPYGKHSTINWGPVMRNNLAWFLMELPALLVVGYFVIFTSDLHNKIVFVAGVLWGIHYVHRSIIYPIRIKTRGKKMPLVIVVFALVFNTVNGFLNGYWLANFAPVIESNIFRNAHVTVGVVFFLIGFAINKYHDWLLIKLRKRSGNGYKIPFGGLFKFVSCPNFFGEIISWLGFFIVTLSLPAFSFLVWTLVNLLTRALDHHKWYLKEFSDYPKERKAVFPYLL